MTGAVRWMAIASLVLVAASHGTFFAFSTFILRALGKLPAIDATRAMQSINASVLDSVFIPTFLGAPIAIAITAVFERLLHPTDRQPLAWLVVAFVIYGLGVVAVTGLGNVPLNQRLAVEAASEDGWARFAASWSVLNHVRTVASGIAVAAAAMALRG